MDVLSDVLSLVRLRGNVYCRAELTAPWGLSVPEKPNRAGFLVVVRGGCLIEAAGLDAPLTLTGGDFVVLPRGGDYVVRDQPGSPVVPFAALLCPEKLAERECQGVRHGGAGRLTSIVAGSFEFEDGRSNPLLAALPRLIHVRGESGDITPWLEATLKFMSCETENDRPGAAVIVSRLTDVLFIQAVRSYIADVACAVGDCESGWLRALADARMGRALRAIHEHPEHAWTVEALAEGIGMSRSAFAARFAELVGMPPLTYVTRWRMLKAGELIRRGTLGMAEVAARVGYESEAAFGKAFKREIGVSPGAYRRSDSPDTLSDYH